MTVWNLFQLLCYLNGQGLLLFISIFSLCKSESVQYFQFDQDGNMFIYGPGSGFSGIAKLVRPGDELFTDEKLPSTESGSENCVISMPDSGISTQMPSTLSTVGTLRPFKTPLKQVELEDLSHKNFSEVTMKKVKWAVNMYRDWRNYRIQNGYEFIHCDLDNKETINRESLVFALSCFITEVKKLDGTDFPGKTLYDILICLQFNLESIGFAWKLLNEEGFKDVKYTLDNVMKLRTQQGLGVSVRKAQVLSAMDEDYLWSIGYLGTYNPEVLLNTLVFVIGKGLALWAGKEHHRLRAPPFDSQLQFMHDEDGIFIRYTEDIGLKTNKGGIKHKPIKPKVVDLFPISNIERCPVRIIMKYLSLLPHDRICKSFYLQPKKKYNAFCYYQNRPAGVKRLRDTVKDVCKKANLPGFYSNHSLRSTVCTRMYNCNIDEQLIMEISGHRSLAVRSYKRTCPSQCKYASKCLFENPQ